MPNMMALWVHLLLHAETKTTKRKGVTVRRGQLLTSLPQLSEWTGLSIQTLRTALKRLESARQITCRATHKATCITICNFANYQVPEHGEQHTEQHAEQQANNMQTTCKTASIPISSPSESKHNVYSPRNKKETPPYGGEKKEGSQGSLLSLREQAFYDSLRPFQDTAGGKYPGEMLRSFFTYWSEPNKSKTKMRFELEKTWDLSRRLSYWASREPVQRRTGSSQQQESANDEWDEQ